MRFCAFALVSWLLCVSCAAQAATPRDPYRHFFDDTFGDFSEELARARGEGKKGVLLFFEMDECPFCHRMKSMVLSQPDVQAFYREHFLCFVVDIEGEIEIVDFAGNAMPEREFATTQHRVRATPVFAFFDLEGKLVQRYTGATSGAQEFMWLGRFVADGLYRDGSFTRYKRAMKRQLAPQ